MTQWGFYLNIVTIQIIISKKEIVRCYYLGAHITSFIDEILIIIIIEKLKKPITFVHKCLTKIKIFRKEWSLSLQLKFC